MPMEKPEDFGGGKIGGLYCKYCSDYQGNLLPRDQVRQNMVQFYTQTMGKSPDEAAIAVDQVMATMPAWQSSPTTVASEPAVPVQPSAPETVIEIGSLDGQPAASQSATEPQAEPLKEVEVSEELSS